MSEQAITITEHVTPSGTKIQKIVGFPGLQKRGDEGWMINSHRGGKKVAYSLKVYSPLAAIRIYTEWEFDPEAFDRKFRARFRKGLSVKKAIDKYLEHIATKKLKPATVTSIKGMLVKLEKFYDKDIMGLEPAKLEQYMIETFPNQNTRNLCWRKWASFGKWLVNEGLLIENIFSKIKFPATVESAPEKRVVILEEDIKKIIAVASPDIWKHAFRVMWALGLRPGEIACINTSLIHADIGELEIFAPKVMRHRRIPIVDPTVLHSLYEIGNVNRTRKLRPNSLSQAWRKALRRAGFQHCAPDCLRHTRITLWLREGCALTDVARWAGHKDIQTTMHYLEEVGKAYKLPDQTDV